MNDPSPGTSGGPDDTGTGPDRGLDLRSIGLGALVAFAIVVPFAYARRGADSGSSGVLFLGVLLGFGVGGAIAGRHSTTRYLTHGAAAGLLAVVAYLVVALIDHAATGRSIAPVQIVFTAMLAVCCGMLGANVGDWRRRKRDRATRSGGDAT